MPRKSEVSTRRPPEVTVEVSRETVEKGERVHPLVADAVVKIDDAIAKIDHLFSLTEEERKRILWSKDEGKEGRESKLKEARSRAVLAKAELHLVAGTLVPPDQFDQEMIDTVKSVRPDNNESFVPSGKIDNVVLGETEDIALLSRIETIRLLAIGEVLEIQYDLPEVFSDNGYRKTDTRGITEFSDDKKERYSYDSKVWNGYYVDTDEKSRAKTGLTNLNQELLTTGSAISVWTKDKGNGRGDIQFGRFSRSTTIKERLSEKGYVKADIAPLDSQTLLSLAHIERAKAKFLGQKDYKPNYPETSSIQVDPASGVEYVVGKDKEEERKNKADAQRDYVLTEEAMNKLVEKDLGEHEPLTENELRKVFADLKSKNGDMRKSLDTQSAELDGLSKRLEDAGGRNIENERLRIELYNETSRLSAELDKMRIEKEAAVVEVERLREESAGKDRNLATANQENVDKLELANANASAEKRRLEEELQKKTDKQAAAKIALAEITTLLSSGGFFNWSKILEQARLAIDSVKNKFDEEKSK